MTRIGAAVVALGVMALLGLLVTIGVFAAHWHAAATAPPPVSGSRPAPAPPRDARPIPTLAPLQPAPEPTCHTPADEQATDERQPPAGCRTHVILVPVEVQQVASAPAR
jgi:hypothetical protein